MSYDMNDFLSRGFKNHDVSKDKSLKKHIHLESDLFTSLVEMGAIHFLIEHILK